MEPVEEPPGVESLPNEESLHSVALFPSIRTDQMPLADNKNWIYNIFIPDSINQKPVPLIIALHGGNGGTNAAEGFMECLPIPGLRHMNAIIFAPTGGHWWGELNAKRVVEFVRLAKLHWPIDTNKVAVTGYSNGGTGSIFFAKNFPETFSAAIPMGGDFMEAICPSIPTYLIHGSEDELYSSSQLKRIVDGLAAGNCDIQLQLVAGARHGSACQMRINLREAADWLEQEVWKD